MAVAQAVASGSAQVGMGVASAAKMMGLDFIPVGEEEYDFLLRRDILDTPEGKDFIEVLGSTEFAGQLDQLGGYILEKPGVLLD